MMEVLQTSALPLGYRATKGAEKINDCPPVSSKIAFECFQALEKQAGLQWILVSGDETRWGLAGVLAQKPALTERFAPVLAVLTTGRD